MPPRKSRLVIRIFVAAGMNPHALLRSTVTLAALGKPLVDIIEEEVARTFQKSLNAFQRVLVVVSID